MKKLIIFLAAIAMVGASVATASAAADLYGSVRFRTYFNHYDSDYFRGGNSYGTTEWKIDGLTRLGMNFKSGDITGKWEIDAASDVAGFDQVGSGGSNRTGMRLRLAYGVWNFGAGTLLIGQDFPLTDYYVTSIYHTDNGMQGWGGLGINEARISQIKVQFGGLRFALVTPYTKIQLTRSVANGYKPGSVATTLWGTANSTAYLPKFEARYDGKVGNSLSYMAVAGFQAYKAENAAPGGQGYLLFLTTKPNRRFRFYRTATQSRHKNQGRRRASPEALCLFPPFRPG